MVGQRNSGIRVKVDRCRHDRDYFARFCWSFASIHPFPQLPSRLEMRHVFLRNQHCRPRLWIASLARWLVVKAEATEATDLNSVTLGKRVAQRAENGLYCHFNIFSGELRMLCGELEYKIGTGHGRILH